MSKFLTGSICLTDIVAHLNAKHSAFSKSEKNGKIYVSIKQWLNDDPDQYGNHASIQLNSTQDGKERDKAANGGKEVYIGNMKVQTTGGAAPADNDLAAVNAALGVQPTVVGNVQPVAAPVAMAKPADDLPF